MKTYRRWFPVFNLRAPFKRLLVLPTFKISESFQQDWSRRWPKLLWLILCSAITLNLLYLLWPQPSETLRLRPHPALLSRYMNDTAPVLVQSEPDAKGVTAYELLDSPAVKSGTRITTSSKKAKSRKHAGSRSSKKANFNGIIHLNTAVAADLQKLPGIGEKTALRILAYRKQAGGFKSVEQLMDVSGIGPKKFGKMAPHLAL